MKSSFFIFQDLNNLITFVGVYIHDSRIHGKDAKYQIGAGQLLQDIGYQIAHLLGHNFQNQYGDKVIDRNDDSIVFYPRWPIRDLYIWSVLTGRFQLSIAIWKRLSHPLAAAIVTSRLLQSLSLDLRRKYPQFCQDQPKKLEFIERANRFAIFNG